MTGQSMVENTSSGIAVAAITSPFWLEQLRSASEVAGIVIPILGCVWLVAQILHKVKHWGES